MIFFYNGRTYADPLSNSYAHTHTKKIKMKVIIIIMKKENKKNENPTYRAFPLGNRVKTTEKGVQFLIIHLLLARVMCYDRGESNSNYNKYIEVAGR